MEHPTALITGSGRGIGRAVAVELGHLKYRLALVARTQSELEQTARLCPAAYIHVADITKPQAVSAAVQECVNRFGRLDQSAVWYLTWMIATPPGRRIRDATCKTRAPYSGVGKDSKT